MQQVKISTPHFVLHAITPEFIHECFRTKNQDEIMKYFGADEKGYAHLKSMHENGMKTFRISHESFLIVDKKTDQRVGECGFHTWNATHRRAELFYFFNKEDYRGKGYMSEILPVVLEYGFTQLNLHRIAALSAESNNASIRLLEKNGFVKEGVMREDYNVDGEQSDSVCFSLLKWEWEKRNAADS